MKRGCGIKVSVISDGKLEHTTYSCFEELQQLVKGNVGTVLHELRNKALFVAYASKEGRDTSMPPNKLATVVLRKLGFILYPPTFCIYGPVVILSQGKRGLQDDEREFLEKAVIKAKEDE
jgi:hypothetical protein